MILNDTQINDKLISEGRIAPHTRLLNKEDEEGNSIISYGLSSFGYDMRLAGEFKVFTNVHNGIIDPKNFRKDNFVDKIGDSCVIPSNSFVLARTIEYVKIPDDIMTICLGKSTYARCGIITNITPLEPGWEGHITLEISNTTPSPARVYANEGIIQVLFFQGTKPCTTYADRQGKYQKQRGVTLPIVGG